MSFDYPYLPYYPTSSPSTSSYAASSDGVATFEEDWSQLNSDDPKDWAKIIWQDANSDKVDRMDRLIHSTKWSNMIQCKNAMLTNWTNNILLWVGLTSVFYK